MVIMVHTHRRLALGTVGGRALRGLAAVTVAAVAAGGCWGHDHCVQVDCDVRWAVLIASSPWSAQGQSHTVYPHFLEKTNSHTHTHTRRHAHMHAHPCMHTHTHMPMCTHAHTHTHTHTHTYTHTQTPYLTPFNTSMLVAPPALPQPVLQSTHLSDHALTIFLHLHLHLGFVHPLQDVALHQCLPSSSVCSFPNPGGSLLLCYVILPSSAWSSSRPLPSPWLPLCASLCPPIVL